MSGKTKSAWVLAQVRGWFFEFPTDIVLIKEAICQSPPLHFKICPSSNLHHPLACAWIAFRLSKKVVQPFVKTAAQEAKVIPAFVSTEISARKPQISKVNSLHDCANQQDSKRLLSFFASKSPTFGTFCISAQKRWYPTIGLHPVSGKTKSAWVLSQVRGWFFEFPSDNRMRMEDLK